MTMITEPHVSRSVLKRSGLLKLAEPFLADGGTITIRNNTHLRWTLPNGRQVFTSASTSDRRATIHRIRRDLKLNGWEAPR